MASEKMIRIAGRVQDSIVEGPGIRYTLFVQGCPHRCKGCHNPETHDFEGGTAVPVSSIIEEIRKNPLLDGITLSGGEPFSQADKLLPIAKFARSLSLSVWIYSGWTYEELTDGSERQKEWKQLLSLCDVLVDGPFELPKRSLALKWKGSTNQRVIDLKATQKNGVVTEYISPQYGSDYTVPKWG